MCIRDSLYLVQLLLLADLHFHIGLQLRRHGVEAAGQLAKLIIPRGNDPRVEISVLHLVHGLIQALDVYKRQAETFVDALNRFSEERPASRTADIQSEQQLETDRENRYVSNNIGMRNVYQRLLLNYKNQCSMEILSLIHIFYTVDID